jgi:hypothetical protein
MSFFSLFNSPTPSVNTAPKPTETGSTISPQEIIGSAVEKVEYLKKKEPDFRNAKTLDEFFAILKPLNEIPFNGGISVSKEALLKRTKEYVVQHLIQNELPEQTLSQRDARKEKAIKDLRLENAVEGLPEFKNILSELVIREMVGQTLPQAVPLKKEEPIQLEEASAVPHTELPPENVHQTPEEEPHHTGMDDLSLPLSAYVSLNEKHTEIPLKRDVGGEIAPVGSVAFVAPLTGTVSTPEEPTTSSVPAVEDTPEQVPVSVVETVTHEEPLPETTPTQEVPPTPEEHKETILEEIGTEIELMTEQEIKELEQDSLETQPKESHEGVLRSAVPARPKLLGVKPPKNYLQRIEEIVGTFAVKEEELLEEYIGKIIGHEDTNIQEQDVREIFQQKPHLFRGHGRIIGVRLIGAHSLPKNEVLVTPANSQLVDAPQKSATVSVLRPKQSPKQDRIPSSSESDSYTSFTADVENKPTPSSQEPQAPAVENTTDTQIPSPIVEEAVTQTPTTHEDKPLEIIQEPTTPETNSMIHFVVEGETIRDIVHNHLTHTGAFEGLSEQEQNEMLVKGIVYIDEKKLTPNVNDIHAGQTIDLSTLTKEALLDTTTVATSASTSKPVSPFNRFGGGL